MAKLDVYSRSSYWDIEIYGTKNLVVGTSGVLTTPRVVFRETGSFGHNGRQAAIHSNVVKHFHFDDVTGLLHWAVERGVQFNVISGVPSAVNAKLNFLSGGRGTVIDTHGSTSGATFGTFDPGIGAYAFFSDFSLIK